MCGLAVMLGLRGRPPDPDVIRRMTDSLAHRGPDDGGIYLHPQVGFGFRRLSIIDRSAAGHQPMRSEDGELVIVFNGEIYNYVELREELRAAGYRFRSTSDTEVLLAAYRHWGPECLSRLNGMWAFVIHDVRRGVLFGARDRFGVKPLFFHRAPDCWLFASELKAVLAADIAPARTNWDVAAEFLLLGELDETPATFYAGIEQLPAGCAFELRMDGAWRQWRYWSLAAVDPTPVAHAEESIAELLEDSVRLRLRSDVPVGVCLSGGLDSTAIICAMARQGSGRNGDAAPLLAFCYHEPAFDERAFIGDTLAQTGARLQRISLTPEATWESLTELLRFQDEPVHSGAPIAGFHLMKLAARSGVKVVLNGQGADEIFAGYAHYFQSYWYTLLRHARILRTWREVQDYVTKHGGRTAPRVARVAAQLLHQTLKQFPWYRRVVARGRRRSLAQRGCFTPELVARLHPEQRPDAADLDSVLRRSLEQAPLPHYLRIEDRNSMAHGVEVRLPFLDYRLVSLAFRTPADRKLQGGWNKALLRAALRGRIPESVRTRVDKMGFPTSLHAWLAGALAKPLQEILTSRAARERGIYNIPALLRLLRNGGPISREDALRLFYIAEFELWHEMRRQPAPELARADVVPGPAVGMAESL